MRFTGANFLFRSCRLRLANRHRGGTLGSVVRFPGDLITEHDRRRLTAAAGGSPFDLEFRKNGQDILAPYLTRCGHLRPSYRLRKTVEGWEAIALGNDGPSAVAARARNADELFRTLAAPAERN
jgi:hypothetical protein